MVIALHLKEHAKIKKKQVEDHLLKMFISLKMPHENASLYHLYFMLIIYFVLPTKSLYPFSPIHYNNDTEFDSYTTTKKQPYKDEKIYISQNYFLPDHYFTTSLKT